MGRSPCCDKAAVKRGPWSAEEDARLRSYIERRGGDAGGGWIALPRKAGLRRCGKSCRLRWLNYLRPGLRRGAFTAEEDRVVRALHAAVGSRWTFIAAHLPGRTDNAVKNYWNTRRRKRLAVAGGANGYRLRHDDANAVSVDAAAAPPSWSSQQYNGDAGAGGGTNMIAGTAAAAAPADTSSYRCEPAATELDVIFRSIGTSGGERSDLSESQSSTGMEALLNWNYFLQSQNGESVLQNHLGIPYSYW